MHATVFLACYFNSGLFSCLSFYYQHRLNVGVSPAYGIYASPCKVAFYSVSGFIAKRTVAAREEYKGGRYRLTEIIELQHLGFLIDHYPANTVAPPCVLQVSSTHSSLFASLIPPPLFSCLYHLTSFQTTEYLTSRPRL